METYDLINKQLLPEEAARLRNQVLLGWPLEKKKLQELGSDKELTLLDLGCGPGIFSELVGEAFPRWNVIGLDNNIDLLPKESPLPNVTFKLSHTDAPLPLADSSVDIVYCRFLFQHLTDTSKLLQEAARVLRPGGIIIAIDVDDRGVIFSPTQTWITDIYAGAKAVQGALHGNRLVGATLPQLFTDIGFGEIKFEVIPMNNFIAPSAALLQLAFGLKRRFLEADEKTAVLVAELDQNLKNFAAIPAHVIYIPIFFCCAKKPQK